MYLLKRNKKISFIHSFNLALKMPKWATKMSKWATHVILLRTLSIIKTQHKCLYWQHVAQYLLPKKWSFIWKTIFWRVHANKKMPAFKLFEIEPWSQNLLQISSVAPDTTPLRFLISTFFPFKLHLDLVMVKKEQSLYWEQEVLQSSKLVRVRVFKSLPTNSRSLYAQCPVKSTWGGNWRNG